ncbi:MAG: hypothetical protein ACTHKG_16785, partial [Nocardioides sp.]
MRTHRGLRLAAGLVTAGLVLAGCGQGSDDGSTGGTTDAGGGFSVYVCEPEHLIPQNTNETCGAEVLNALFTPLVNFDPKTTDALWG